MKYLFVAVGFCLIGSFVNAECDDKTQKAIGDCYKQFIKSVDIESALISKKFCKDLNDHQKCMQESAKVCSKSPSSEELLKIFGTDNEHVLKILFMEHTHKYLCEHEFKATKEEEECVLNTKVNKGECEAAKDCAGLEKYGNCLKEQILKKCKNEDVAKVYTDAANFGYKQMLPSCP